MTWPEHDAHHLIVSSEQMENYEREIFSSGLPTAALMEKVGQSMAEWFKQNQHLLKPKYKFFCL